MANSETTRTPDGGPYRRKDAVFSSAPQGSPFSAQFQKEMGYYSNGVEVSDIYVDQSDPVMRYQPGHPDADASGYVAYPKMNPAEDMVDLMAATRGYDANVSAMSAVKDMIQRSIDLLK
jgi:flagellar basal-body rod protein FlgC